MAPKDTPTVRDTRAAIIDAAIGLFSARGFRAVSTREIAKVVGIASPSIYKHFASIDEIVAEAVRVATRRRGEPYRAILAKGAPAPETLKAITIAMIAGLQRDPTLVHLYQQLLTPQESQTVEQVSALWEEDLYPAIIDLVPRIAPDQDPGFTYYLLFSFILGQAIYRPIHELHRPLTQVQRDPVRLAEHGLASALPGVDWARVSAIS